MIDQALKDQNRNLPFQQFILLEDDVSKYRNFPDSLEIPDDSDIMYIGLSPWGIKADNNINCRPMGGVRGVYYTNIDDNIIRIFNMTPA